MLRRENEVQAQRGAEVESAVCPNPSIVCLIVQFYIVGGGGSGTCVLQWFTKQTTWVCLSYSFVHLEISILIKPLCGGSQKSFCVGAVLLLGIETEWHSLCLYLLQVNTSFPWKPGAVRGKEWKMISSSLLLASNFPSMLDLKTLRCSLGISFGIFSEKETMFSEKATGQNLLRCTQKPWV